MPRKDTVIKTRGASFPRAYPAGAGFKPAVPTRLVFLLIFSAASC